MKCMIVWHRKHPSNTDTHEVLCDRFHHKWNQTCYKYQFRNWQRREKDQQFNSAASYGSRCVQWMRWWKKNKTHTHLLVKTRSTYQSTTRMRPRRRTTTTIQRNLSEYSLKSPSSPKQQESGTGQRRTQQEHTLIHSWEETCWGWGVEGSLWGLPQRPAPARATEQQHSLLDDH